MAARLRDEPGASLLILVILPPMGQGLGGTGLATLMPALVLLFNAAWSRAAVLWLRSNGER